MRRRLLPIALLTTITVTVTAAPAVAAVSPDPSFGTDGAALVSLLDNAHATTVKVQGGLTYLGGYAMTTGGGEQAAVARLLPNGSPDTSFRGGGATTLALGGDYMRVDDLAVRPSGKIVLVATGAKTVVAQLNPGGGFDGTFGSKGRVSISGSYINPARLAIDSKGRIVVGLTLNKSKPGDYNTDMRVVRLKPGGGFDGTFGNSGRVTVNNKRMDDLEALALDSSDRVVVAGRTGTSNFDLSSAVLVARLRVSGALDKNFSGDGKRTARVASSGPSSANFAAVDGKGRAYVGLSQLGSSPVGVLRMKADGSNDGTYGSKGLAKVACSQDCSAARGTLTPQGVVLVGFGYDPDDFSKGVVFLTRFTAAGKPDATFGAKGQQYLEVGPNSNGADVAPAGSGRVVVAGSAWPGGTNANMLALRLAPVT